MSSDDRSSPRPDAVPLGFLLHHLSDSLGASLDAAFQELGVSLPQVIVLAAIARHGARSQLDLGGCAGINRTRMVSLLDELEAQDLVQRQRDPDDRRVYRVLLTEAGRERLCAAGRRRLDVEERWLSPLSPQERTQFRTLLLRLAALSGPIACPPLGEL
jgi:DNA-binding MarR family transcriptional regulator